MRQLSLWDAGEPLRPSADMAPGSTALQGYDPMAMAGYLRLRLGRPVRLVLTNNRSTMLSYKEQRGVAHIRLHKMFRTAPPGVLDALADYLARDSGPAGRVVDDYIAAQLPHQAPRELVLRPKGRVHDLQALLEYHNSVYFHGTCEARITWGKNNGRRRRRSIQLGIYIAEDALIRIHPCLDQAWVPEYYVGWVVFHEMLHEVFGVAPDANGRRAVHPPEFVAVEESHPDFLRCKQWEQENLPRLLRYRGA